MTFAFIIGFRLQNEGYLRSGVVLVYSALLTWPLYVLFTVFFSVFYRHDKAKVTLIKKLQKSHFLVPLGAVLAVLFIPLLYLILG